MQATIPQFTAPIPPSPIIPVGYDRTRAWIERYPLGEVAALVRRERTRPRLPQIPRRSAQPSRKLAV